jgi:hypothetical protein
MTQYDNTNRGVLFDNDRKEADNHPDMTGSLNINGVEHWFSGWWKNGAKGEFLSLSIGKPKEQQQQRQQAPQQRPPERRGNRPSTQQPAGRAPARQGFDDMDDDIPF